RPIGIFRMLDKGVADDKILAVPARDPIFTDYHDITDIPKHYLAEVGHFFEVYKDLEGMRTKPIGWENAAAAKTEILRAMKLYQDRFHMGGL
ncbi:MAG: inorganic diphosphatase, partial [Anaerolineae bacterium]